MLVVAVGILVQSLGVVGGTERKDLLGDSASPPFYYFQNPEKIQKYRRGSILWDSPFLMAFS